MLAVTTLLIIIFMLVVIALSNVIVVPELSTYVMCRLFYHASIFRIIRKHKYMQRMHGGGPKINANCINLTRLLTVKNHPKLTRVLAESSCLRHRGISYSKRVAASVVEQVQ